MTSATDGVTLRERTRHAVRQEISRLAWGLFADQGFEATTVDQIAAASGMSARSFFRYFAGKDELLLERLLETGDRIARALADRPAGEAAWVAVRAAFDEIVTAQEQHAERARQMHRMLGEPAVRASVLERQRRWKAMLAPLIALRLPPGPDARPLALAGCAVACLEAAQELWALHPDRPLGDLLDEAMSAVAPVR